MGALFHRERTGEATTVDVSLLGTGMWSMGAALALSLQLGVPWAPPPKGGSPSGNPLVANYRTKDDRYVALCCLQPGKYWPEAVRACRAARAGRRRALRRRRRDPGQRPRGLRAPGRGLRRAHRSTSGGSALADFSGQWAIVQNTLEAAADPQAVANGYVSDLRDVRGRPVPAGHRPGPVRRRSPRRPSGRRSSTSTATPSSRASATTGTRSWTSRSAASSPEAGCAPSPS